MAAAPLRALLIQAAKKLLEVNNPLQKWGLAVAATRTQQGGRGRCAQTLCRSLAGHVIGALERMDTLHTKLSKLATDLGVPAIKTMGYETKTAFIQQKLYLLRTYPGPNHMSASPG